MPMTTNFLVLVLVLHPYRLFFFYLFLHLVFIGCKSIIRLSLVFCYNLMFATECLPERLAQAEEVGRDSEGVIRRRVFHIVDEQGKGGSHHIRVLAMCFPADIRVVKSKG